LGHAAPWTAALWAPTLGGRAVLVLRIHLVDDPANQRNDDERQNNKLTHEILLSNALPRRQPEAPMLRAGVLLRTQRKLF
jgi:hypothetical protein